MAKLRALFGSPWLRVGGTVLGVVFLVHNVDVAKAGSSLLHANWWWMSVALALTCIACLASVFEWGVLLRSSAGLGVRNPAAVTVHHGQGSDRSLLHERGGALDGLLRFDRYR